MAAVTQDTAVSTGRVTRVFIYLLLLLFALFYLLPLAAAAVVYLRMEARPRRAGQPLMRR